MSFPPVTADINDVTAVRFNRSVAIPAKMATMLIVVALVVPELVLQVSSGPKEGLIQ